ncbi:flagellar filament capping protein FliD [Jidongwangia harbinensis]|uniref:flagellar filament capping protein FliD n=1 Tax=Jidongwangia harbinensis TaxID=2878561 RepID=UPI001CD98211|nr:flagellar filament capping protein FliD [Jidongwangia harbinensis]MCA2213721.1 flagellar filament capping protein FliD [Jidongwangia harbinensis]
MASIDGLVTGMSTTDTINQLMKIEAAPQTALKNKITTANKVVTAYQSVNSRLSSMVSAANALGKPETWDAMKATATSDAAVVSAKAGTSAGSMSFLVERLATTQVMTFKTAPVSSATADPIVAPDPVTGEYLVKLVDPSRINDPDGGLVQTLTAADGSLKSVVAAINAESGLPYTAAAVQINTGEYTLQLTAKASGSAAATNMGVAGLPDGLSLGSPSVTVAGGNAQLKVGTDDFYVIESATNTFADVMPGVTVTAAKKQAPGDTPVTISIAADTEGIAAKVQALVDNANVVLNEIASQSKAKTGELAAGPLVGDSTIRKLTQDILGAVSSGAPKLGLNETMASFKDVGIKIDETGRLEFKKETFVELYTKDPAKAEKFFAGYTDQTKPDAANIPRGTEGKFEPGFDIADGLARKLETIGLIATKGVADPRQPNLQPQGTLKSLMDRRNDAIRGLNDQVSQWDLRLENRRAALQTQFSGLEVALGKMQQQSSWLASQLAGLA